MDRRDCSRGQTKQRQRRGQVMSDRTHSGGGKRCSRLRATRVQSGC